MCGCEPQNVCQSHVVSLSTEHKVLKDPVVFCPVTFILNANLHSQTQQVHWNHELCKLQLASAEQHLQVALIARSLLDPLVHRYCRVVDLTSRPDVQGILVYTGMSIYQYIPVYTRPQNHYTSILPPIALSNSESPIDCKRSSPLCRLDPGNSDI